MNTARLLGLVTTLAFLSLCGLQNQTAVGQTNYDESKVPEYTLPDPLKMEDGREVTTAQMWCDERRPEVLQLFEEHVYGRSLGQPPALRFELFEQTRLWGQAVKRAIVAAFVLALAFADRRPF